MAEKVENKLTEKVERGVKFWPSLQKNVNYL
jgi:hypothetical protein